MLLLLAGASRWLLAAAHPETASTPASAALGCAWAALLLFTSARAPVRLPNASLGRLSASDRAAAAVGWRDVLAGALLLAGPAMPSLIGGRALEGGSVTMALALTPVVVAIATAAAGGESGVGVPGRVWPGLAAVAGLLLILIEPSLADARSDVALLLAPLLTGIGAALFCANRFHAPGAQITARPSGREGLVGGAGWQNRSSALAAAAALAGGALLMGGGSVVLWLATGLRPATALSAVACDGLLALLGVLALARLGPTRWSAQFALLPLLIVLEGLLLVRPTVTARIVAGLVLLALASGSLLLPPNPETPQGPAVIPR